MSNKSKQMRKILNSGRMNFAIEAHNGLSAKIAEEAGFPAIWASSFSISTSLGKRDINELTMSELIYTVDTMTDITAVPVLVDGDTGYGNYNNVKILVRKLEQAGAAGVCIEDKQFPKINSYLENAEHELTTIKEFCGKIKAAKDSVTDKNFVILARTEELNAGGNVHSALDRAYEYIDAGADGIFVHSNKTTGNEIIQFANNWDSKAPIIICPTTYYKTPTSSYENSKISLVIWANHSIRAAIKGIEETCKIIFNEQSVASLDSKLFPIKGIFKKFNYDEIFSS